MNRPTLGVARVVRIRSRGPIPELGAHQTSRRVVCELVGYSRRSDLFPKLTAGIVASLGAYLW
jgi:hypothetical protein